MQTLLKTSYTSTQHSGLHDAFESLPNLLWASGGARQPAVGARTPPKLCL